MFSDIKKQMQLKFSEIAKLGTLYYVEVDRDKIWEVYLNAIPAEKRQSNNCNCCKSFLRQFGGIVGIKNNLLITLWDFIATDDEEYGAAVKALRDYVVSLPIKNVYFNTFAHCGTDRNPDGKNNVIWEHFHLKLPPAFVKTDFGPIQANALGNKEVLERSLNEITDDAVETVIELINQNSLYRGSEFKNMVVEFQKIKERYKKVKGATPKNNFCWLESITASPSTTRIKNSAIGTLLNDLSEGRELDSAVAAYEKVTAPTNYKRPTSLVTPKMVDAAKKRLEELGLTDCLYRRMLSEKDLTVNNSLFVYRQTSIEGDVFDQMKKDTIVNPKSLSKVEEIAIDDFIKKVLPTAKSIKVLVENKHLGNFVSLVGPKTSDDTNTLFKWGNNFSWSYTGEVTDSIKERVKEAGGKVDGVLRVSLSWDNTDDLDLQVFEPDGYKVYFGNRKETSPSGAMLDVDANGGDGMRNDPCENICWANLPKKQGEYKVVVNQYSKRESSKQGFEVEVEFNGETYNFSQKNNGATGVNHYILTFNYSSRTGFKITSGDSKEGSASYRSTEKWKIKTGQFHLVKSITLSPNYWNAQVGNKHFMFFLDGCKTDTKTRGFYNEFLKEELAKDRKVFEILGSKITVEPAENELSGIGFSDTLRNDLIVEVTGSFKRTLRIKF